MKTRDLDFVEVPELGIKITPVQHFNGKTYPEILEEVSEEKIPPYELLQKLRNIAFESNWEKYPFMKSFWVFVPNSDKASKANGYFASLGTDSDGAYLDCNRYPSDKGSVLGVFFYEKITDKAHSGI